MVKSIFTHGALVALPISASAFDPAAQLIDVTD
jgi:hypothetical protein